MRHISFSITTALGILLCGCSSIDGPQITIDKYGPVIPAADSGHRSGSTVPLYSIFSAAESASRSAATANPYVGATDATDAQAMLVSGSDLIKQNCDDYFDSSGRIERRLLFGRDVTTFAGAIGTTVAIATR